MANDKFRKMRLRSKAKPTAAQPWDEPRKEVKKPGKRTGNGRRREES